MSNIRVIHLTHSISRLGGGLFESVRHLSKSVDAASSIDVGVVALADARSAHDASLWEPIPTRVHAVRGPQAFGYAPSLVPGLIAANADVLHVHGVWKYPSLAATRWYRQTRRPYIVSPHGMLEPWALKHSRMKKRLSMWLYQGACLRNAACLRATSMMEVDSIRAAGFSNPVALIPNGVEMPATWAVRGDSPSSGTNPNADVRTALFLSRIHPKKGLLNLIEAWRQVAPSDWRLVIVGPDEGGHLEEVKRAARAAGLQDSIEFPGEAWGDARWEFFRDADLFVLPTFSENFGLVIAEALACRVPVITTRATPWEELESHRCGWWIETGVEPLVAALKEALATSGTDLHAMGDRGRRLVTERYAWEPIGRMMAETFRWLAGRTTQPDYVIN
jgi:glycosyltransferase involved in cell wall biosynthesis